MNDTALLLTRAYDFAARMHAGQRRKGADAQPYINHLCEVAGLLSESCGGRDGVLIAGGVLHDTIEDTGVSHAELVAAFGSEIADLVREVSDDKSLPKLERKRLQIVHAADCSPRARLLKIADKTSNLRSLAASPPADWPTARCREYVDWSEAVVAACRGLDDWLEARFDEAAASTRAGFFA